MHDKDCRQFLTNVGRGMLVGSLGAGLAADLGTSSVYADVPTIGRRSAVWSHSSTTLKLFIDNALELQSN